MLFPAGLLVLSTLLSGSALAADTGAEKLAFPVQAYVQLTPGLITVSVQNRYAVPLVCQGRVTAVAASGASGWFNYVMPVIYPGLVGYAYVNAGYGDVLVNGWAEAFCQPAY